MLTIYLYYIYFFLLSIFTFTIIYMVIKRLAKLQCSHFYLKLYLHNVYIVILCYLVLNFGINNLLYNIILYPAYDLRLIFSNLFMTTVVQGLVYCSCNGAKRLVVRPSIISGLNCIIIIIIIIRHCSRSTEAVSSFWSLDKGPIVMHRAVRLR